MGVSEHPEHLVWNGPTVHCIFALSFDGRTHPDHAGSGPGVVGVRTVGPRGLLETLCVRLGLGRAQVPRVLRTATWLRKLELAAAGAPCFWSASLSVAPWACAETLLGMRDELVEAGWTGSEPAGGSARLSDLALTEFTGPRMPAGRAELMREVVNALAAGERPRDLSLVEVVDARADLPPIWARLLDLLAATGVEVRRHADAGAGGASGDLAILKAHLAGAPPVDVAGDGTVCILAVRNGLAAAEAVADWLAAACSPGDARTVVIAEGGDSGVLDRALARRFLPTLGLAPPDAGRGALALLPAAFAVRLAPRDPQAVADLLALALPPIDRWAARRLLSALRRQPAFDGPAWAEAWTAIEARLLAERGAPEARRLLGDWRRWFEVGVWDGRGRIGVGEAVAFCDLVAGWAEVADAGVGDPLVLCVRQAAVDLRACVRALGGETLDVRLFQTMMRSAAAAGVRDPHRGAEVGPMRAVGDAGALWAPCDTVVWWGFAAPPRRDRPDWRPAELAALAAVGIGLDRPAAAQRRREAGWRRAVGNAASRLVFVEPACDRGSRLERHPLAADFSRLVAHRGNAALLRIDAARLLAGASRVRLAGRDVERHPASMVAPAGGRAGWELPASLRSRADGRIESASSIGDLVACQWRWTLRHALGLRACDAFALRSTERVVGDLAHELARHALPVGSPPDPALVRERALQGFDAVLAATAAPLLRPAMAAELAHARRSIPLALAHLARLLADAGCRIEGFEVRREGLLDGIDVRSRFDMLVRDRGGGIVVVDLKWTGADAARREEVEAGAALQLAVYARLAGPGAGVAYYLLRSRRFFAASPSPGLFEAVDVAKDVDAVWSDLVADVAALRAGFDAGEIASRGAADPTGRRLATPAPAEPCRFCGYRALCRVGVAGPRR